MKKKNIKKIAVMLVLGLMVPLAANAAEADLQLKVDKLTKEVNDLKGAVKKVEDKSIGKWLTIGGEYRFRVDSLHGETVPYSDAIGTMQNMTKFFLGSIADNSAILKPAGTNWTSGVSFFALGKSGSLFTGSQMGVLLNQYMPAAMGTMLAANSGGAPGPTGTFLANLAANPAGSVAGFPTFATLTPQQQKILSGLTGGLPGQSTSVFNAAGAYYAANGGDMTQFNTIMSDPIKAGYLMQAMMQAFLGDPSKLPAGLPPTFQSPRILGQESSHKPKNETLYTNKFGLDLTAKATQDITVHAKLDMYKTFGSQNDSATMGNFFADRVGTFDGTLSHVPSDSLLNVDRAFATWSNILDQPLWFSVGRRPSTNGAPSNLRLNNERPGNGGTPALLVDYAFDGMTVGYAPDIDALPGAYAKVCYGRGFDSGITVSSNSVKDTDMLGVAVIPVDTDPLRVWMQWNRGFDIFDFPSMNNTIFGNTAPAVNLGSIDWYGIGAMSTLKNIGPGKLNFFTDFGLSVTHPNNNVSDNAGFQGLMTGAFFAPDAPTSKTGWAAYAGIRYDLPSKTKIGFEFNHGSKDWITFAPAADDMWTSKVGTRGNVYEPYIIQELDLKPISSYLSKGFFKLGYQYYDFEYTGSNNWVGAPVKISSIQPTDLMLLAPMKKAHDVYATFEVKF
ncbi:MAG: DUF3373 domain-containing protein [Desulfuromonadaceae bacterium]|nr:DUF3373 domain-containing protein [Desulfuromonadaceae bacterium]